MSAPYNPGPGDNQPGQQPQSGGYPSGANYPQQAPQGQPAAPEQGGYPPGGYQQPGDYQQGGYPPSGYQQPGNYQQGGYQQQPPGYGYDQQSSWGSDYGSRSRSRESASIVGLIGAAVGGLLLIISATSLNWYSEGPDKVKLSDLKDAAKAIDSGLLKAYSGYLVWILLVAVVAAAVIASLPVGSTGAAFRVIAPVLGALGVVLTLLALNSFWSKAKDAGSTDVGIFKHSAIGLYLALLGFVVAGIAGVFGPRRA